MLQRAEDQVIPSESASLVADEVVVVSESEVEPVIVVTTTKYYVVIEVSAKALSAHMAHGDLDADGRERGDRFEVETVEEIPIVPGG